MNSKNWQLIQARGMLVPRRRFLALLLASAACSGKKEGSDTAASSTAEEQALAGSAGEASGALVSDLGALVDLIVAEVNDLPRVEFDPSALVATIGKDPQKLFEWVRNRTYWAPYRGLLRGSKGVMLDRIGSSLDRAVLLGDLLRRAGYTVRLANAQLPEVRAHELLGKVQAIPAQRRMTVAPKEMPAERRRAMAALMPHLEQEIAKENAEAGRIRAEAEALVGSQSEMLLTAVREAASPSESEDSAAIAALRDHWWIERQEGHRWVAMDVLLPDSEAGNAMTAASSTSDWKAGDVFPSIPETSWHTVQLRVVVERYEAGATSEFTVLESLLRPAEQLERPITLGHWPRPWPNDLPDPTNAKALREHAFAVKEWVPYIQAGEDLLVQSGFSIQGDLQTNPLEEGDVGKAGGLDVAGGIDMALGGFGTDEAVPAATAEWLDFEIHVPGSPPERLRRPVFDLLGPARRASKASDFVGAADLRKLERFEALFGYTDILLQPCDFTDEFVVDLISAGIVANQAAMRELSQESDPAKVKEAASEILGQITSWGPLPSLVLWRSALAAQSADTFLDRPNVLSYRVGQAIVNADEPRFHALIDIASNITGARRGADRSPFEIRLRQGVADTVAEMLALGSELRMAENTASIFARLASEGSRGLLIAAHDQSAVEALPWPDDEAARVAADVESGYITLVPRKALLLDEQQRVGWWRVNPATGETIGVMDTGFHQATEDTITRARVALRNLREFVRNNAGYMRQVVQNPNAFPTRQVQTYRRIFRVLKEVEDVLGGSL
jgi:hypothetical protein